MELIICKFLRGFLRLLGLRDGHKVVLLEMSMSSRVLVRNILLVPRSDGFFHLRVPTRQRIIHVRRALEHQLVGGVVILQSLNCCFSSLGRHWLNFITTWVLYRARSRSLAADQALGVLLGSGRACSRLALE